MSHIDGKRATSCVVDANAQCAESAPGAADSPLLLQGKVQQRVFPQCRENMTLAELEKRHASHDVLETIPLEQRIQELQREGRTYNETAASRFQGFDSEGHEVF